MGIPFKIALHARTEHEISSVRRLQIRNSSAIALGLGLLWATASILLPSGVAGEQANSVAAEIGRLSAEDPNVRMVAANGLATEPEGAQPAAARRADASQ